MNKFSLVVCLCFFTFESFAGFSISPLKVEVDPNQKSAVLTARNEGDKPLVIQVTPKAWRQLEDGSEEYTDTSEVLAFPRQVTIAPKSKQTIRIGIRPKADKAERSYRLLLEEIPNGEPGKAQLKFVLAMSLPIFVRPFEKVQVKGEVTSVVQENGLIAFAVTNTGNHYFRVGKIKFSYQDKAGKELGGNEQNGWYVLSNSQKWFKIPVNSQLCRQADSLDYSLEFNDSFTTGSLTIGRLSVFIVGGSISG